MDRSLIVRDVAVTGAGIAGLTAALALARAGARVTVYERAAEFRAVGAGIQISPNAYRVMTALGLGDQLDALSLGARGMVLRDWRGNTVAALPLARNAPDSSFRFVHRAVLTDLLGTAARKAGAEIRLGHPVDTSSSLPDADLVIAADGLHSRQRAVLNGATPAVFSGQTAWRAVIAAPAGSGDARAEVFMGPGRHLVSYPLAGGLRNIVAVLETPSWTAEGWALRGDPAQLRAAFARFGGPVPDWLARVQDCGRWGLFVHEVARKWHDTRCVLIGDAAHPTLPFLAQGACMAIEDAYRLTRYLGGTHATVPEALAAFTAERRPRVTRLVAAAAANARNFHLDGARRILAHAGLRALSATAPAVLARRFDWIYDHDPVAQPVTG